MTARQTHQVQCSQCGTTTEVPFAPDPTRPVYCAACYRQKQPRRIGGARRPAARPAHGPAAGFVERDQ